MDGSWSRMKNLTFKNKTEPVGFDKHESPSRAVVERLPRLSFGFASLHCSIVFPLCFNAVPSFPLFCLPGLLFQKIQIFHISVLTSCIYDSQKASACQACCGPSTGVLTSRKLFQDHAHLYISILLFQNSFMSGFQVHSTNLRTK